MNRSRSRSSELVVIVVVVLLVAVAGVDHPAEIVPVKVYIGILAPAL